MALQFSPPLRITLDLLHVLLESCEDPDRGRPARFKGSGNSTTSNQLLRIPEWPAIQVFAEQLGLCRPGEFTATTVNAIVSRICVHGRIDQQKAFGLPLSAVVRFLKDLAALSRPTGAPTPAEKPANSAAKGETDREAEHSDPNRWLSLAAAERISGIHRGNISRMVDEGKLKSNGKKGKGKRKVDTLDFVRLLNERAIKPARTERAGKVEDLVNEHVDGAVPPAQSPGWPHGRGD